MTEKKSGLTRGRERLANHKYDRISQRQSEIIQDIAVLPKLIEIVGELPKSWYGVSGNSSQRATEDQEFLQQLSKLDFTAKQKDSYSKRHADTGQWLLESPEFQTWRQSEVGQPSVLWCPGNPGVGKTIITSIAVNHIIEATSGRKDAVAYIYCDYANSLTLSVAEQLGSMVRQLTVQTSHAETISELRTFLGQIAKTRNMTEEELCSWMERLSRGFDMVYIFVDALDECPEISRDKLLTRLQQFSLKNIRVFLTGRHNVDVKATISQAMTAEIVAANHDVAAYLKSRIEENKKLVRITSKDPKLKQQILDKIVIQADGLFLLAELQLESLSNQTSVKGIRSALERLPTTFPPMYDQTIRRIHEQPGEGRKLALQVLSLVFGATRPLEVDELRHALATERGDTELDFEALVDEVDMLSATAGLVITYQDDDHHQNFFRLVHYTLQEYLETKQDFLFPALAIDMATRCLSYLSFEIFGGGQCTTRALHEKRKVDFSFLHYAAFNWAHHLRKVQLEVMDQSLAFVQDSMKTSAWLQSFEVFEGFDRGLSSSEDLPLDALFLAAHFDLSELFMRLIASRDINTRNNRGETPLLRAVDVRPWQKGEGPPLCFSSKVQQSQERREPPPLQLLDEDKCAMVQVILDCDADINARDPLGNTAVFRAVASENLGVLSLLLDRGADTNVRSNDGYSLLHVAAQNEGRVDIMEYLLSRGGDVNVLTENGESLLHVAAEHMNSVMLEYLVDSGACVDVADNEGITPLLFAAGRGRLETVSALIKRGANLDLTDRSARNPLHVALDPPLEPPRSDVIDLLLRTESINARDVKGRTPLHHAYFKSAQTSRYDFEDWDSKIANVIELLIAAGASESIVDEDGRIPKDYLGLSDWDDEYRWKQEYLKLTSALMGNTRLKDSDETRIESIGKPAEDSGAHEENDEEQPQGNCLYALVEQVSL